MTENTIVICSWPSRVAVSFLHQRCSSRLNPEVRCSCACANRSTSKPLRRTSRRPSDTPRSPSPLGRTIDHIRSPRTAALPQMRDRNPLSPRVTRLCSGGRLERRPAVVCVRSVALTLFMAPGKLWPSKRCGVSRSPPVEATISSSLPHGSPDGSPVASIVHRRTHPSLECSQHESGAGKGAAGKAAE